MKYLGNPQTSPETLRTHIANLSELIFNLHATLDVRNEEIMILQRQKKELEEQIEALSKDKVEETA